jgi:hypothetical protein
MEKVERRSKYLLIGCGLRVARSQYSPAAGRGVFVTEKVHAGQPITVYDGELVLKATLDRFGEAAKDPTNKYIYSFTNCDYAIKGLASDAQGRGAAQLVNHSLTFANSELRPILHPDGDDEGLSWTYIGDTSHFFKKGVYPPLAILYATKDLLPGDELLYTYTKGTCHVQGFNYKDSPDSQVNSESHE